MISYLNRAILNTEDFPDYLGVVLRYHCPNFLDCYNIPQLHAFLEWKYVHVDQRNHHCVFWPCWLFSLCPTTQRTPYPISGDNHWHCIYGDCPRFINHVNTLPYLTNLDLSSEI